MAGLLHNPTDSEITRYIKNRENFHVEGHKQEESVEQVEKLLESNGFSVRVKTKGREATLLIPAWNVLNLTAQLAHTIATFDPDWVIYKAAFGSKIEVKYFGDA